MEDVSKLIMNLQALCICSKIWIFFVSTRQLILIAISGFDLLHQKEKKVVDSFFFFFTPVDFSGLYSLRLSFQHHPDEMKCSSTHFF